MERITLSIKILLQLIEFQNETSRESHKSECLSTGCDSSHEVSGFNSLKFKTVFEVIGGKKSCIPPGRVACPYLSHAEERNRDYTGCAAFSMKFTGKIFLRARVLSLPLPAMRRIQRRARAPEVEAGCLVERRLTKYQLWPARIIGHLGLLPNPPD